MDNPLRIVFFGTPWFAAECLEYLLDNHINVIAVVTKQDKPAGRFKQPKASAVKALAEKMNLPLYQPAKASDPKFVDEILKPLRADLFIVVAFGEIFKNNLLSMPSLGCVNVHASLLPKYRGAAPIARSIMAGEVESGVTIMSMAPELDAGEILAVHRVKILPDMTMGELTVELAKAGKQSLLQVIEDFSKNKVVRLPQDTSKVTYANKILPSEGKIDWNKPVQEIYNIFRGVTPKPGAWCEVEVRGIRKRLLIKEARPLFDYKDLPGKILEDGGLIIACGEGAFSLLEIQLEGKSPMKAEAFLRGFPKITLRFF